MKNSLRTALLTTFVAALAIPAFAFALGNGNGATSSPGSATSDPSTQIERVRFYSGPAGCFRVVSAGVVTRNASTPTSGGTITLPAGPTAANIVWAGLYWVILGDTFPPSAVTLNGFPVGAALTGPVTGSPCWGETSAFAYFADVTTLVTPGANTVGGLDDSGILGTGFNSEGASLVVVYQDPNTGACEIIVTDGNDLLTGGSVDNPILVTCGAGLPATVTFIGADGQVAGDDQIWNGGPLGDGDDFDSSDPLAPGATPSGWDTDSWGVITGGVNVATVDGPGDCISWVATVLEVGVSECTSTSTQESSWGGVKALFR